jgi:DNA mismatch repair ATPase MutL
VPGSALSISRIEQIKQSQLQVKGFLVPSLLPSRSHQHILINGRLQDDADYTSHHGADLRTTILQILEASYIGSNRRNTQNCDAKDYASSGRYFGYFVDIQIGKPEQLDQKDLEMVIRNIISEVLQANNLLISVGKDQTQTGRRNDLKEQSPTKKLRTFSGLSVENNAFVHRNNVRQYKLDRAGLLREPKASDDQASWVREALSSWKSTLPEELPEEQRISSLCKDDQYGEQEGHLKLDRGHTLQRTGLASSRVVGQVDAKYISIVYGDDTLVLVDQHAAHERVRLEAMLSQYVRDCLDKHSSRTPRHTSKLISLPVHLARAFKDEETIQSLAFWGFDILLGEEQRTDALIQIDAIPCIMNEKLGSDQALGAFLVDLAASLEDESVRRRMKLSPLSLAQAQSENGWIITLGHLPTPILDLFNSMACRGAIMFNDPLTHSQCERLIKQLSDTTFCFICAHGRPVTAPIASLQLPHTRSSPIRWSALRE